MMREMLESIFGEGGAVMAQFIITLIVVLALIALVYWLVGHFSGVRLNGAPRGRAPRLAILDALSVDSRRKLVLVRRDNVEHLLLIGGPADLVVEPSIVRTAPVGNRPTRPSPSPAAPAQARQNTSRIAPPNQPRPATPPAAATPVTPQPQPQPQPQRRNDTGGASEPIPFPQAQRPAPAHPAPRSPEPTPSRGPEPARPSAPPPRRQAAAVATEPVPDEAPNGRSAPASARFEEQAKPARIDSVLSLADTLDDMTDQPAAPETVTPAARPASRTPAPESPAVTPAAAPAKNDSSTSSQPDDKAQATTAGEAAADEKDAADNSKVSDLEKEMARLLGEITAKREG